MDEGAVEGGQQPSTSARACLKSMGCVKRQAGGNERVSRLRFDDSGTLLGCLGTGKSLEIFRQAPYVLL